MTTLAGPDAPQPRAGSTSPMPMPTAADAATAAAATRAGDGGPVGASVGGPVGGLGGGVARSLAAPSVKAPGRGTSIREFLTDGSLANLCVELSALSGLVVELRDEAGLRIVPAPGATPPWRVEADAPPVAVGATRVPIRVEGRSIGELVVGPPGAADAPGAVGEAARARVTRSLELVASTSGELCTDVLDLRHRVQELAVLFRLSSLLANQQAGVEVMLQAALDSALEVFGLDAGSVVLFPEGPGEAAPATPAAVDDEREVQTIASSHLSPGWLSDPLPLSKLRRFDRLVLAGETLAVEDLWSDPRVLRPERCRQENIRGFVSTAMVFRGRPIGVFRLYSRTPRRFSVPELRLLRTIGEQAATAVQQARLLAVEREERRMERQLRLARDVQTRMLPAVLPRLPGLDVAARSDPSYELGGDFYDAFLLGEGASASLGLVVGDVVGKGVAAALLMSAVRASLRAYAQNVYDLDRVIANVNVAMCRDTLESEFATLWYGVVEPGSGRLTYCSAGHEPPFLVRVRGGKRPTRDDVMPLGVGGLVLGVDPAQEYPRYVHQLESGDVLVAFTDGVTDARNFQGEKWGWSRFVESVLSCLSEKPGASAADVLDHVVWASRRFVGLRRRVDDETLVVLRRT